MTRRKRDPDAQQALQSRKQKVDREDNGGGTQPKSNNRGHILIRLLDRRHR